MHTAILWFRQDLRLADNPALHYALSEFERVIPLYIHAPEESAPWQPGAASRWWLHHSLASLDETLRDRGSRLILRRGPSLEVLQQLIKETQAEAILCNRLYEPAHSDRDSRIKQALREQGITVQSFNAALLFEPWQVLKENGEPYRVFTPYWKACQKYGLPQAQHTAPKTLPPLPRGIDSEKLDAFKLLPSIPWDTGFKKVWNPGETGALQQLEAFLSDALAHYESGRDTPGKANTSRLSPALHFGEIGPRQLVSAVEAFTAQHHQSGLIANAEAWLRQLVWREFAHALLYHYPHTSEQPFDTRFEHFAWERDYQATLRSWQRGETGIPIVDAGMRELWHTGWMHNRVRMIVASLLSKNLLIPWQEGARWFWDTLVDADLANNSFGWQWVAGSGNDAAPYFRIFNPVLQGEKFDAKGRYVRRWLPELAKLPDKYLHKPWQAPEKMLSEASIILGETYPRPIVDLKASRERALERFLHIKGLK
ncbi:MAG: deoxyribodipyrimidine photo-lyase [Pseudomonadota bacterium]